jgi:hypothetical protein
MTTETVTQASPLIYPAMAAIMSEIPAISKDSQNVQQGFKYRGIDAVYNALNPILANHGVFMLPELLSQTREERTNAKGTVLAFVTATMKYHFVASDGSEVSCVVCGEGMDSGDKATNKAMSIAQKYALFQAFCIPTKEDKDPDKDSHEVKPRPPRKAPVRPQNEEPEYLKGDAAPEPGSPPRREHDPLKQDPNKPSDRQRRAFFAALREAVPEVSSKRERLLDLMSHVFSRPIESSDDLTVGEMSSIISDPMMLRDFLAQMDSAPADSAPMSFDTAKAIDKELDRIGGTGGQLPPELQEKFGTGDASELNEAEAQEAIKYLKGIK